MDNGVQIRLADTATDIEMLRTLFLSYCDAYIHDADFVQYVANKDYENELARLPAPYQTPGGLVLATLGDKACGGLGLMPFAEGVLELKRMYLYPKFRGQGIAKQLITFAQAHARQVQGIQGIVLSKVPELFTSARELYVSMGFTETPPYWDSPFAGEVYMRYTLA